MPARLRARALVDRDDEPRLPVFARPLATDFVRPCSVNDVVTVLVSVPPRCLSELGGVYLMAGTTKQSRARVLTHGMYFRDRVYLFPVPARRLVDGWPCSSKPTDIQKLVAFGATVSPSPRRGVTVTFDEESLRRFYLFDVLLHELGHHVDRQRTSGDAERYARWFAEFQYAQLPSRGDAAPSPR